MTDKLRPAADLFEFRDIQKFTKAVRAIWPGAKITLRPNSEFVREHESEPGASPGTMMTGNSNAECVNDGDNNDRSC